MSFCYKSGNGDVIDFSGEGSYLASPDALSAFKWSSAKLGTRVSSVYLDSTEAEVDVWISSGTEEDGAAAYKRMADAFEHDLAANEPGTVEVNGYRASSYAIACEPVEEDMHGLFEIVCRVTFVVDGGAWTKDKWFSFSRAGDGGGLSFPFGFPFSFGGWVADEAFVENIGASPSPVSITVHGPASNPAVLIAGNRYEVAAEVKSGGSLVIDGISKTIRLYDDYGNWVSVFDARRGIQRKNSGSFTFQRVPTGVQQVRWDGSFSFDAVLHEVRGAPLPGVIA